MHNASYLEINIKKQFNERKRERIPCLLATLRYKVLSRDSLESPIVFLQLLLAVTLKRRPACRRAEFLFSITWAPHPYWLATRTGGCISHVISMHCLSDPKQTVISDLSKVILYLVAPRFEHSTLVVRAKQHKHSAIATKKSKYY
jgi:hypothetical protein